MYDRRPAPRLGPPVTIRFRSKAELERVRRAARSEGMTLNTFVASRAAAAAEDIISYARQQSVPTEAVTNG